MFPFLVPSLSRFVRVGIAVYISLSGAAHAVCDDDGKDDDGKLKANISNSACVNGVAAAAVTDGGGGGVNVTPPTGVPPAGLVRAIAGTNASTFTNGLSLNSPVTPGEVYQMSWSKGSTSTVGSLHTLVEPTNLPAGYKVQVNTNDGKGWVSGNKLQLAATNINVTAVSHKFRIVRPIRQPGKVGEITVTKPVFAVNRTVQSGETRPGLYPLDADNNTYYDMEVPVARFLMPLGAALENSKPVTAGDLILNCPLYVAGSSVSVTRDLLSYEGVDRTATGVVVLTDSPDRIRQIKAPEIFVDVVTISSSKFEIRLYSPAAVAGQTPSSLYSPTGTAFSVWTIQSISSSDGFAAGIRLIEAKVGATVRSVDAAANRTANQFQTRRIEGVQKETVVSSVFAFPSGNSETVAGRTGLIGASNGSSQGRTQTLTVERNGDVVQSTIERYLFANSGMGESLLDSRQAFGTGSGDELLTQEWNVINDSYASAYGSMMGMPYLKYFPDGSWERYTYAGNGTLRKVYRPYEGTPTYPWDATDTNCVVETYTYAADPVTSAGSYGAPSTFITFTEDLVASKETKILGTLVGKTVYGYTATTVGGQPAVQTITRVYRNSSNYDESTEVRYHESALGVPANMPVSRTSETGAKDSFSYERGTFDPTARTFTTSSTGLDQRMTKMEGTTANPAGIANKTTRILTIRTAAGTTLQETTQIYTGSVYETASVTDFYYDSCHRINEIRRDGRTIQSTVFTGNNYAITNEQGVVATITVDLNGRITSDAKAGGPTAATVYDGLSQTTTIGDLTRSEKVDLLGRPLRSTITSGEIRTFEYPNNGRDTRTIYPGNLKVLETRQVGGRLASITNASGNKIIPRYYTYGVNTDGSRWTKEAFVTAANVRWNKTTSDWRSAQISSEVPAPSGTGTLLVNRYYSQGLLAKEAVGSSSGLAPWLFSYGPLGELYREGRDLNGNGVLDPASTDTMMEYDRRYEKIGGDWYGVREIRQYQQDNNSTPTTVQVLKSRLNALSGGTAGRVIRMDANGIETVATQTIDRTTKTVTTITSRNDRTDVATQVSVNGLLTSAVTSGDTAAETYQYDTLERLKTITDARTGKTTTRLYNSQGLLASLTEDALPRTTSYAYYAADHANAGEIKQITNPDGKITYYSYNDLNLLLRTWGAAARPEEYEYNSYGEVSKTTSYRSGSGWTAATWPSTTTGSGDATTVNYFPATGLLKERIDALTRKTEYTWNDNGNLATRKWARGTVTTFGYDSTGLETARTYSDGLTPAVSSVRDRNGRTATSTDASGSRAYSYNPSGLLNSVAITGSGILTGYTTSVGRDAFGRPETTGVSYNGSNVYASTRTYQPVSGRLKSIVSGNQQAEYLYAANSNLIREIIWRRDDAAVLGQSRIYDDLDRIASIKHVKAPSVGGPTQISSYGYTYDLLDRRKTTAFADGSFWDYAYNDRSELTAADKKLVGGAAPYAGQQFRFSHDNAGNRLSKESGGDITGASRRTFTSTANALNQRATQATPATFDILGTTAATSVTVNGTAATRQGNYFRSELTASNSSAAAWTALTVTTGTQTTTGSVLTAPASVTPTYDDDGNLLTDGVWAYTWDGENRLIKAIRNLAGIPYREVRYSYDGTNRLIQKQLYHASGGSVVSTEKYLYEAGRKLLTTNAANQAVQSFYWGLDLSGSQDGAGGAGGLLWIKDHAGATTHLACMDANANITHLIDAATGNTTAAYEYSPHGELLRMTGAYAAANPFRFSTKSQDADTGLLDYGRRFFKPDWGIWLSRDPAGNVDGLNRYGFCGNNPISRIDVGGYEWLDSGTRAWLGELLNPISIAETFGESISDPDYWRESGHNMAKVGEGFYNGAKGAVDGIKSLPEMADFLASGKAKEMLDKLINDPEFQEEMANKLGKEFCDWLAHVTTNDGAFEFYGEQAFNVLSGAALGKLLKAFDEVQALEKFSKKIPKGLELPEEKIPGFGCFVAGTVVATPEGEAPIETLAVGQRVLTGGKDDSSASTSVDPALWKKITLRLQNPESPSSSFEVFALRPLEWIKAAGVQPHAVIQFRLEEMGVEGPAEILAVGSCPVISSGPGRVILATITHINQDVRTLHLDDGEILEPSGSHPLFSLDRGEWTKAKDLRIGEILKTRSGQVAVTSIERKPGAHQVYNLEIETEHQYFVGADNLLSHNSCWEPGDSPHAPTRVSDTPSDSTVRRREWKNEAESPNRSDYTPEDNERMAKGKPPQRFNPDKGGTESMERSHEPTPKREGGKDTVPRWPQEHAEVDPYRRPGY